MSKRNNNLVLLGAVALLILTVVILSLNNSKEFKEATPFLIDTTVVDTPKSEQDTTLHND